VHRLSNFTEGAGSGHLDRGWPVTPRADRRHSRLPPVRATVGEADAPRTFTELYFAPVDFSTFQRLVSVLLAEP
jgi:hypothetical protein